MEEPTGVEASELEKQTYQLGGHTYRLESQSWKQCKWLGDKVFRDRDVRTIDYGAIHDCGRESGPLFMAITLLADGQTRADKSRMTWEQIEALSFEFEGALTGWEVARFCTHFFYFCRPEQMVMLIPGKVLQEEFVKLASSLAPGANGSTEASSPLPMETSSSKKRSAKPSGLVNPTPISGAALNDKPSTAPSLASVE
jgi:hypothetical protein